MKSLIISGSHFPPQVGGISRWMGSIAEALGPRDTCCLTAVPRNGHSFTSGPAVKTYRRPAAFCKERHIQAAGFGAAIVEVMLRERPQVVQVATAYDGYIGLWMHRWLGLPFVLYAHGNEVLDTLSSTWPKPRLSLLQAARVLANSQFTAGLVRKAGVPAERVAIIHPGCDIGRFRPLEPTKDRRQELLGQRWNDRVLLSVGNLVERKGHDTVIRALPRAMQSVPGLVYLVAGDGPYRRQLESLALAQGVQERVIFLGRVADEELPEIYGLSDVFVMPSRDRSRANDVEGFGMVFLEASACAKPVIASRSGGIKDAVLDSVTGIFVDPQDADDLAKALTCLLLNRDFALRLGQQGRARVAAEFTWIQVANRVREILESVLTECRVEGHVV